jgi:hypothetical protein
MNPPTRQTVAAVHKLLVLEKDLGYQEGVYAIIRSFEKVMLWLDNEDDPTLSKIKSWVRAEHVILLRAHPFLGPVDEPAKTRRTKVFEVEYNYFEPGTRVTPTSVRSVLDEGQVYTITECHHPRGADDRACCCVEGREIGLSTEYLREVKPGESP